MNNIKSTFQLRDWHTIAIDYVNTLPVPDTSMNWKIRASISSEYLKDRSVYFGSLSFFVECASAASPDKFHINSQTISIMTMESSDTKETSDSFVNMIKKNGAVFHISSLRNFLLQFSSVMNLPTPLILPNINLNNFDYDTEYPITVNLDIDHNSVIK